MSTDNKHYDIFISYRRDGGFETAQLIADRLKQAGYNAFFDLKNFKSGNFEHQLYMVIEQCTDFIIVLPEDSLERCNNSDDWVKNEILYAILNKKNIVPIMLHGFEWPKEMPEGMKDLPHFQGIVTSSCQHFDAAVERLKTLLKSKPNKKWRLF